MKTKLIVVDISSFIFRAFYAIRPLTSPEGIPVNAVHGVWNMMFKLLTQHNPTHVVIARDTGKKTFRHELYKEYKANRTEVPEDLIPQFPLIHELVDKMDLAALSLEGYEADDVIGSICSQWANEFDEVLVASGDKDLMQFVNDRVKIIDTMKDKIFGRDEVFEKMNVWPEQIVDYLSLVGDASDNIPGMKGVGAKGAAKLLADYQDLDGCIKNKDEFKGKRLVNAFENHLDDALLSKELVKIVTDLELPVTIEDSKNTFIPNTELISFFEKYGFKSAIKKLKDVEFGEFQAQQNDEEAAVNSFMESAAPVVTLTQVTTTEELNTHLDKIQELKKVSVDTFFDSENINSRQLTGVNFYYGEEVLQVSDIDLAKELLRKVWGASEVSVFTEHAKRDLDLAYHLELETTPFLLDVVQLHYLVEQDLKSDLPVITEERFGVQLGKTSDLFSDEQVGERVKAIFDLGQDLLKEAQEKEVFSVYENIDFPLFEILAEMERTGVFLNPRYLNDLEKKFSAEVSEIEKKIGDLIEGETINLRSSKQVGHLLFDILELPTVKKTKTGYSTDSSVLEELDALGQSEIPGLILKYREIDKLLSTYIKALPEILNKETKRIHTNFSQHTAATGRLASSSPNIQNIPIRTENGKKIRKAFIATPGNLLLTADYSQVELRLLAHFSEDETMVEAFQNGKDIHAQTASEVTGLPLDQITSEERSKAKAVNFGLMYGQSSFGLSKALKISRGEAKDYITSYFQNFSQVKDYLDSLRESAEQTGYAQTMFHRKRFLPNINSTNRTIKSQAERVAINSPIQGTAADIIKKAMIDIFTEMKTQGLHSKMILQVHDELIFDVVESELEQMKKIVQEKMENVVKLKVPLTVDMGIGVNWYDLK